MQTLITKGDDRHYFIHGEKWLVGHGADAPIGVLVARTSTGPLGITAILLTPENLTNNSIDLYRHHLNTSGLKGARLSRLVFNNLRIKEENILGYHLSPIKRGMMAVMKTFNRMRPGVAAFAVGHAQAVLDYTATHLKLSMEQKNQLQKINTEVMSARLMLYQAATMVDKDPIENAYASVAKVKATYIAEKAMEFSMETFGPEYLLHPLLTKWQHDVYGYEYMEGTTHIQLKNIYQGYVNNKFQSITTKKNVNAQVMAYK
ncbi:MAG: hypothetical protein HKM04_05865 [Legionellales bacterium]|nr:hypothetical protein [Legionellales bacterium]